MRSIVTIITLTRNTSSFGCDVLGEISHESSTPFYSNSLRDNQQGFAPMENAMYLG